MVSLSIQPVGGPCTAKDNVIGSTAGSEVVGAGDDVEVATGADEVPGAGEDGAGLEQAARTRLDKITATSKTEITLFILYFSFFYLFVNFITLLYKSNYNARNNN
jgi:hypothetical protein